MVGWFMSLQNQRLNRAAVSCLAITAEDSVLEIGCGPGQAIKRLVKTTPVGRVVGIDPSLEMLGQAASAHQEALCDGRVSLVRATVEALPFNEQAFSCVIAVSTFHDWKDRRQGLRAIRRVLRPGGQLVLCLRRAPRISFPWSSPGLTAEEFVRDQALLDGLGYRNVRLVRSRHGITSLVAQSDHHAIAANQAVS